MGTVQL